MPNQLSRTNSPYLLQHAENPVDWMPWGDEAFSRAQEADRPIFLSIGYAACHWCHVMAHESFEDPEIASFLNEHFVNVKVDREERPDVDHLYMNAVTALTGQGGWPLSVFLTPDGQPFYGGTYFPPQRRYNLPSFYDVLASIARIWREDRQRIFSIGEQITAHLNSSNELLAGEAGESISPTLFEAAEEQLSREYDWLHGGWGRAPKFPQGMAIEFLLRRAAQHSHFAECSALRMASHALVAMARGGMYDVLGGGFARYSTDDEWRVPHFEKMLYDNALLANAYTHAYLLSKDVHFLQKAEETLKFIAAEMTHPLGGYYSSLDADSEGVEGKYYLWSRQEIEMLLTKVQLEVFDASFVTPTDEAELFVLQRKAGATPVSPSEVEILEEIRVRLFDHRSRRIRPSLDDKVLVGWNAMVDVTLIECFKVTKDKMYLEMAIRNLNFVFDHMLLDGDLFHSWREGQLGPHAFLEDYAGLIRASLALYQISGELTWFHHALALAAQIVDRFASPSGGFFDTEQRHGRLISRPMSLQDNATPSGNSQTAQAFLELYYLTGDEGWNVHAHSLLPKIAPLASRYPLAFSNWLAALDLATGEATEIALLGESTQLEPFKRLLWARYRPNLVLAAGRPPFPESAPGLLKGRAQVDNQPTAYVCRNFTCLSPVTTPEEFRVSLGDEA